MLLMLEDDAERLERFAAVLRSLDVALPLRVWRDAHAMIREIARVSLSRLSHVNGYICTPQKPDQGPQMSASALLASQRLHRVHPRRPASGQHAGGEP